MDNMDIFSLIKIRRSVRNYERKSVDEDINKDLLTRSLTEGPFKNKTRFVFVSDSSRYPGNYGIIRGTSDFVAGFCANDVLSFIDFGYCMESLVLNATAMNLGTCWLGGTFNKKTFFLKAGGKTGEVLPAVVAIGYPAKKDLLENIVRNAVSADTRKPHNQLFFDETPERPLNSETFFEILEGVRLAPSSSNRQPWRIIKKGKTFNFYCIKNNIYDKFFPFLHYIDMGIAMFHFQKVAEQKNLKGRWLEIKPEPVNNKDWIPFFVWEFE